MSARTAYFLAFLVNLIGALAVSIYAFPVGMILIAPFLLFFAGGCLAGMGESENKCNHISVTRYEG